MGISGAGYRSLLRTFPGSLLDNGLAVKSEGLTDGYILVALRLRHSFSAEAVHGLQLYLMGCFRPKQPFSVIMRLKLLNTELRPDLVKAITDSRSGLGEMVQAEEYRCLSHDQRNL